MSPDNLLTAPSLKKGNPAKQRCPLLSSPIMFSPEEMKVFHRWTTSCQSWLFWEGSVSPLFFIHGDRGGRVGHRLGCCSCCSCTIVCLKTANCNPSFTLHRFPSRILVCVFFSSNNKRKIQGERLASFLKSLIRPLSKFWQKNKIKERNKCKKVLFVISLSSPLIMSWVTRERKHIHDQADVDSR